MLDSHLDEVGWDALKNVQSIASRMSTVLGEILNIPTEPSPSSSDSDLNYPDLIFPPHDEILRPLSMLQISERTSSALLDALHRRIEQLQGFYTTSYRRACFEISRGNGLGDNSNALRKVYQNMTEKHYLPMIQSWVSFTLKEVEKRTPNTIPSKRRFNNHSIPMLLKYFEFNGYPSLSHRNILAKQSDMTLRQIDVWFQNHRKRSKEDGKFVQRLDSDVPLKRALSILSTPDDQPSTVRYLTPPTDDLTTSTTLNKVTEIISPAHHLVSCLAETYRPPHAFPTKRTDNYPDPFPTDNGFYRFPPPLWRRKPERTPIIPIAIDMDDFAKQFHLRLSFINNPCKQESTLSNPDVTSLKPWFAPLITIPPSAPLPALHRPRPPATSTSMLTSVIAQDPFTFVFPNPRESGRRERSNVACIVRLPVGPWQSPSSITERFDRSVNVLDRERKSFRVRRRAPHIPRPSTPRLASPGEIAGRKGTPTSRRGPSSLQTFGSRTSSFTSDTSSDDSSSPSTPPPLHIHSLFPDPAIEADDFAANFDNFLQVHSSPSFDFINPMSISDKQLSSPKTFDFAVDFAFSKSVADGQELSSFNQNHTPLLFT